MKRLLLVSSLILSLSGCAFDQALIEKPAENVGGSALVYRHITPVESTATASVGHDTSGKINGNLSNPEWLTRLPYRDIEFGLVGAIHELTSPATFPYSLVFSSIQPVADIFTQGRDIELKRLDVSTQEETEEVWMPKDGLKIHVKRGDLEVDVDGK